MAAGSKVLAFLKRDLTIDRTYKLSFALEVFHVTIAVAAFYFLAELVGDRRPAGYDSFPFILVGMAVNAYMTTCFVCFSQAIRTAQATGTLKAVLATPTSPAEFLVCSSTYPLLRASLDAVVYPLIGALFGLSVVHLNAGAAVLVLGLSLVAFASIGVLSATFTLVFKRGDPLLWLVGSVSYLVGGVLFPTTLLPSRLQQVADLLPITHAVSGMRAALVNGARPSAISGDLAALAAFSIVAAPLAFLTFSLGVAHVQRIGTLDHQ